MFATLRTDLMILENSAGALHRHPAYNGTQLVAPPKGTSREHGAARPRRASLHFCIPRVP